MLLKVGSTGEHVEILQRFLNKNDDGIFGSGTERAVKKWQLENGLKPDGLVGSKTYAAMGLLSTDSQKIDILDIDVELRNLPVGEYMQGPTDKNYIFLHHTAGWYNPFNTVHNWANDTRGKIATEFVIGGQSIKGNNIDYDGEIVDCIPPGGYGWHLGIGRRTSHVESVGIEVCNFGYLTKGGYTKQGKWNKLKSDKFYTYVGTEADPLQVVELDSPFRGHKYWQKYSDTQIQAIKKLIISIGERDNIDITQGLPKLIKEIGAKAFEFNADAYYGRVKGVWSHTNVRKDKFDKIGRAHV